MTIAMFLFLHNGLKMVLKCSEKENILRKPCWQGRIIVLELNLSSASVIKTGSRHPGITSDCF